jgi:hypothetical protein
VIYWLMGILFGPTPLRDRFDRSPRVILARNPWDMRDRIIRSYLRWEAPGERIHRNERSVRQGAEAGVAPAGEGEGWYGFPRRARALAGWDRASGNLGLG